MDAAVCAVSNGTDLRSGFLRFQGFTSRFTIGFPLAQSFTRAMKARCSTKAEKEGATFLASHTARTAAAVFVMNAF